MLIDGKVLYDVNGLLPEDKESINAGFARYPLQDLR